MPNLPSLNIPPASGNPAPVSALQTPPGIHGGKETSSNVANTPMHENSRTGAALAASKPNKPVTMQADSFGALLAKQMNAPDLSTDLPAIADVALTSANSANPARKDDTDKAAITSPPIPVDPAGILSTMLQLPEQYIDNVSDEHAINSGQSATAPMAAIALPIESRSYGVISTPHPNANQRTGDNQRVDVKQRTDAGQRTLPSLLQFQPAEDSRQAEEIPLSDTPVEIYGNPVPAIETETASGNLVSGQRTAASLPLNPSIVQSPPQPVNSLLMQNLSSGNNPAVLLQSIATHFGNNGWTEEFTQKINWISSQNIHIAELHLNPPELGPLKVVMEISGHQATASFSSPHSAVRESIENALPLLREKLADSGIALINTTVSDQSSRNEREGKNMYQGFTSTGQAQTQESGPVISDAAPENSPTQKSRRHNGMVDTFA